MQHLRYFVSVYNLLSFKLAAQELNISQSTISKGISKLEQQINLQLFERHTRHVQPTEAGKSLYRYANQCLGAYQDWCAQAEYLSQGASSVLNIGCGPFAPKLLLQPIIAQILAAKSSLRIHARTAEFKSLKHGLDNHIYHAILCDVGDLHSVADASDYVVTPLLQTPVYLVANADHPVHQRAQNLQQLFAHKLILPPVPQRYLNQLPEVFRNFILRSDKPDFETTSLDQAIELARQQQLITAVAGKLNADGSVGDSNMQAILLPEILQFQLNSNIGIWRLRSRLQTPQLKEFCKYAANIGKI